MPRRIKMEGLSYGFWDVEKFLGLNANQQSIYWCVCVCGTEREVVAQALREGKSVSCGCKKADITSEKLDQGKGGKTSQWAPEYRAWMSMRRRVSPNNKKMAALYANKGITICPEWESFDQFLADMSPIPHPGWTLDREDNDLGYYKANCRWSDCQVQSQNRRQNQRNTAHRRTAA